MLDAFTLEKLMKEKLVTGKFSIFVNLKLSLKLQTKTIELNEQIF